MSKKSQVTKKVEVIENNELATEEQRIRGKLHSRGYSDEMIDSMLVGNEPRSVDRLSEALYHKVDELVTQKTNKEEATDNHSKSNYYFIDINKASEHRKYGWNYSGEKSRHLGEFDLEILGKITRHNPENQKWDRVFLECQLFYPSRDHSRVNVSQSFLLETGDLLSVSKFRETLFKHTFKSHNFKSDTDLTNFYQELIKRRPPKEVFEFDYYGFVRHKGYHFYMTENALITIPENHEDDPQYMIALDESGVFPHIPSGRAFYVKPGRVEPAPYLRLPRPDDGIYTSDKYLLNEKEVRWFIYEVRENLGELVSGQKPETKPEGYMIFAFMMSFLFFEEIYQEFQHVIYMYIWGEPSTGKGKLSQILLNFFGQSFNDVDSSPTLKSAENKLANHSQIPVIMDEFHPEKSNISSQIFNMWYELRQRGVSASHDRSKNAWNPIRSQMLFISNYKPNEDHFRSRCLMIEYSREKRGRENLVFWFNSHEEDMQRLFVTLLHRYNSFNRTLFRKELHVTKRLLSQHLSKELEKRTEREGIAFQVKDRQIENMTSIIVTNMFISEPESVSMIEAFEEEESNGTDSGILSDMEENVKMIRTESTMFRFAIQFLANSAEKEVQQTPLQQFLATLEVMSEKGELNDKYHGEKNGDIIIYWSGIWDDYTKYQQGREIVSERALRDEIEAVDKNGKPSTHTYTYNSSIGREKANRHGYRIQKRNCTASWYRAFGHRKLANEVVKIENSLAESNKTFNCQADSEARAQF